MANTTAMALRLALRARIAKDERFDELIERHVEECDFMSEFKPKPLAASKLDTLTINPAQLDQIKAAAGAGAASGEGKTTNNEPVEDGESNVRWQDIQGELLQMNEREEPYTSGKELGENLGCSDPTIRKAIKKSKTLRGWKARHAGRSTAPKATTLNEQMEVSDPSEMKQDRSDALPDEIVDSTMSRLINEAPPKERARLNSMNQNERRELAETIQSQQKDSEPSPLDVDKPCEPRRTVREHKRA